MTGYWTKTGNNLYYTSGNIGIGTTNPTAKLDLTAGDIAIQTAQKVIFDSNDTGDSSNSYIIHDAVNNRMDIFLDGGLAARIVKK